MIQTFVNRFLSAEVQKTLRATFGAAHPKDYKAIVTAVVAAIYDEDNDSPSPERIHEINDGDYQGTLVYVIGTSGYQPDVYWFVKVSYGSCSGCDTLQALRGYDDEPPTVEQVDGYMTLALHIVQGLKELA